MIGGRAAAPARAGPCPCGHGQRAAAAAAVPARLPLPRDGRRPLLRAARRRNSPTSVATASTPSSSGPRPQQQQQQQRADRRPDASASAAAATASAPAAAPAPNEDEGAAAIDIDAIPYSAALALPAHVSSTLPPPLPWAPPLLNEEDQAPDEFLRVTSLRPGPEWYPAWMRYRRRDGNDIFWTDKLRRCTLDVPPFERRWTVFSTIYYLFMHWRFRGLPTSVRYLAYAGVRALRARLYEGHKALVLWQCKLEAGLAARAVERRRKQAAEQAAAAAAAKAEGEPAEEASGGGGKQQKTDKYAPHPLGPRPNASFSRMMALRRLHWRNSPVAELLYLQNVALTGRVHMLPPAMLRQQRPTLYWLF